MASGERVVPFYCPYCGEEDIVPDTPPEGSGAGHGHGYWACRSCLRGFRLSLTALAVASGGTAVITGGAFGAAGEQAAR